MEPVPPRLQPVAPAFQAVGPVPSLGGLSRTVAYGSVASWLGPKRPMTKTHRWTLFVRGPHNEDLSYMLRNVEFHLHESFANPIRVISEPPYQVTELGWGEFEARMVLNFIDDAEEPVTLVHGLRLHPLDGSAPNQRVPVLAEFLEDIVFGDDTSAGLLAALHAHPQAPVALPAPHPLMPGATEQSDEAETGRIAAALLTVKQQTQACIEQLNAACSEAAALRRDVDELVRVHGRVAQTDAVALWRPEDYRHVPMMAEHDKASKAGANKKRRKR